MAKRDWVRIVRDWVYSNRKEYAGQEWRGSHVWPVLLHLNFDRTEWLKLKIYEHSLMEKTTK